MGRSQTREVGGEAGEETPSGAGRGGVASTGSGRRVPPETGAEAAGGEDSLLEGEVPLG